LKKLMESYETLKKLVGNNQHCSDEAIALIRDIHAHCIGMCAGCGVQELTSKVVGKEYFAYSNEKKISRAINKGLFENGTPLIDPFFSATETNDFSAISAEDITSACYNIAISFCAVIDLNKTGDQKTPGTFFEYLIGCLFARRLGITPTKRLDILNLDMEATLPTDFIFDLGKDKAKFHVPVKTSTRERVIQVWAHQRVLDGVYGTGRFLGTLACLTETKTDKKKLEVVEICLPVQWRLYQMYIAQLKRVYYLDKPQAYEALNDVFPQIHVSSFGEFFFEVENWIT